MAKWGQGDPRWIVEERPDATNVNNWHWTEKNATPWSKERLQELLNGFDIVQDGMLCTVDAIEKVNGEATVNNRKGKLIYFYEWDIVLKWTGSIPNSKNKHNGKIAIPNLSEENDLDDIELTISIDESNDESEKLKLFMYNIGRDKIRQQLAIYIKELKEEYSKNLILPQKCEKEANISVNRRNINAEMNNSNRNCLQHTISNNQKVGYKLDVRTLQMSVEFQCSAHDLYNALTKPEMLSAFTRGPAKVEPVRGGEFVLYGGNVHGRFEELIPEKKIKQSWRLKNWTAGHFSDVIIELEESSNATKMTLKQTGIPASEFDSMKTNWDRYYWNSMKQTFGFGAALVDVL